MDFDITAAARAVLHAVRIAGPGVAGLGLVLVMAAVTTRPGRARLKLALVGLSGEARRRSSTLFLTALVVPSIAVTVLAVSLALEAEVREGPNRMVDRLVAGVGEPADLTWVMQSGTEHFMNDSRIRDSAEAAFSASSSPGVLAYWSQLAEIGFADGGRQASLVLAPAQGEGVSLLAPEVDPTSAQCELENGRCHLEPHAVVADADVGGIGEVVTIRGRDLRIVAHPLDPMSLLNRAVVFTSPDLFRAPSDATPDADAYGFIVAGPDSRSRAEEFLASTALNDVQLISTADVEEANSEFWAGNGTTLVLLVIAMTTLFSGASLYNARRASQEQARVSIATLRAIGLTPARSVSVDLTRTLLLTVGAAVIAAPCAAAVIALTNAGILGFHAMVTPTMVVAGAGILVLADLVGSGVLWLRLSRASIVEAINGS